MPPVSEPGGPAAVSFYSGSVPLVLPDAYINTRCVLGCVVHVSDLEVIRRDGDRFSIGLYAAARRRRRRMPLFAALLVRPTGAG